jgi:transcriptional regulator with XRE-family HTH domain
MTGSPGSKVRLDAKLLRAARAIIGWEQCDLAEAADISVGTVRRIEQGAVGITSKTERAIRSAFEAGGVELIPPTNPSRRGGHGVRLKQ